MAVSQDLPEENNSRFSSTPVQVNGANVSYVSGNTQEHNFHSEGQFDSIDIPMHDVTAWTPRKKIRIVTVGAGFSGLLFAHKLQHQNPDMQDLVSHTIYESRNDIGGTWLANVYPGVQCDVPAHIYAFPFDPNTEWNHFYASGKEIHDYIRRTTKKWNLDRDVRRNHRVLEALWQEDLGQWKVAVENPERKWTEYADVLISGQGVLNTWRWPDIEGLHSFKGHKCHSAAWDHDFDYSNKKIAVIGNGSSGIQIIPHLAKLPGTTVTSFQRSPNYIYYRMPPAKLLGRDDINGNPAYTEEDKRRFREDPAYHREYRKKLIHRINTAFRMFVKDSPANIEATQQAAKQMAQKLNYDPELCKKLIPDWGLGCRRITPGEGYLESFLQSNVHLVKKPVDRITEDTVITDDGEVHKIDVLACATGFDVSLRPQWNMIGRNGVDLREQWARDPESYLSIAARDMPNYFMFMGPNAVIAHGSLMEGLNWTADYVVKWIRKMATEDIKSVVPKRQTVDELICYGDQIHKTLVWSDGCKSWYKRNTVDGRVTAAFAGSALMFRKLIGDIRAEDFDIEYRTPNRWYFLGNGFIDYELDQSNDLSWYLEN